MRKNFQIFGIFLLLYFSLFGKFLFIDRIPTNDDTYFVISFVNYYINIIKGLFSPFPLGQSLFGATNPYLYGETAIGASLFFIPFRLMGISDGNSFVLGLILIFALTGTLSTLFFRNWFKLPLAFFGGLILSGNNFILGHVDSPHTAFFGIFFLSLHLMYSYFDMGVRKHFIWAFIIAAFQIYFSAYIYLFLFICGIGLWLIYDRKIKKFYFLGGAIHLLIILPFLFSYISTFKKVDYVFPWNIKMHSEMHSMEPRDLFKRIPGNLFNKKGDLDTIKDFQDQLDLLKINGFPQYSNVFEDQNIYIPKIPEYDPSWPHVWVSIRKCGFIGLVLYFLGIFGIFKGFSNKKDKYWAIGLMIVGVILAIGPLITFGDKVFPTPLFFLYEQIPWANLFRVTSRGYYLFIFGFSIFILIGAKRLLEMTKFKSLMLTLLIVLFVAENFPFLMKGYRDLSAPPPELYNFLKGKKSGSLAHLPSDLGLHVVKDHTDLFTWNRELIYMNWQSYHRKDIINGLQGYLPKSRIDAEKLLDGLPEQKNIDELIRRFKLEFLIFHKDLIVFPSELETLKKLKESSLLKIELDTDRISVFKIKESYVKKI